MDVPEYWIEYMNAVSAALVERLDPAVARDKELRRQAAEKAAAGCRRCAEKVVWDLEEFGGILEDAIQEAIAGVGHLYHVFLEGVADIVLEQVDLAIGTQPNEYEDDDRPALVPTTKTNYLLPCDVSIDWSREKRVL